VKTKDGKTLLRDIVITTRRLRRAETDTQSNREGLHILLKQARKAGVTRGELAKATGLTSARIWQITEGE
jgi:hypothetical protein